MTSLPIVCTLTPGDRHERLAQIRKLTAEALLGHDRSGLVLALRYAPEAVERVRAMVAGEQHCCAFLDFDVEEPTDAVRVTITAPENARDAADELFEQFITADHANCSFSLKRSTRGDAARISEVLDTYSATSIFTVTPISTC